MIPPGLQEPEVLEGLRCFPDTQRLYAGTSSQVLGSFTVGWHDTLAQPYRGSFAVVSDTQPQLVDLVGDVLRVSARGQSVLVYVLGRATVPQPISLARRPFMALSGLYRDELVALVERVT